MSSHSISKHRTPKLGKLLPERVAKLLGDRPTMGFEDESEFDMIHAEMILAYDPQDLQEHLIIRDITDAQWQVMRLREMLSAAIEVRLPDAMMNLLGSNYMYAHGCNPEVAHRTLKGVVRGALRGDASQANALNHFLEISAVSHRHLKTEALSLALPTISSISDLIASAEHRRDKSIRRLEERRKYMAAMSLNRPSGEKDIIDVRSSDETPTAQQDETEAEHQVEVAGAEARLDGDPEENVGS